MKKPLILLIVLTVLMSCSPGSPRDTVKEAEEISTVIDAWHKDVAEYRFDSYFSAMDEESFFIGTDANERWTKTQFMEFSQPFFERESTWDFKAIDRNLIIDPDYPIAWFDEVLDTWMGLCRGSGVLKKVEGQWLLEHYVLSLAVPNDSMDAVIQILPSKAHQLDLYKPASPGN
ncbi:MAG: nuclear transport factor 2 family protein [Flavobacteriaceae bacterium]